jgi:hypothetical protein
MTFGAVLIEKICTRGHRIAIVLQRIAASGRLLGSFRQLCVDILLAGLGAFFLRADHEERAAQEAWPPKSPEYL